MKKIFESKKTSAVLGSIIAGILLLVVGFTAYGFISSNQAEPVSTQQPSDEAKENEGTNAQKEPAQENPVDENPAQEEPVSGEGDNAEGQSEDEPVNEDDEDVKFGDIRTPNGTWPVVLDMDKLITRPDPLTLERTDKVYPNEMLQGGFLLPHVGPIETSQMKMQIADFGELGNGGKQVIFEVGNIGSEPLTLTTENLAFVYLDGPNNLANPKLNGGTSPVVVQPNEIKEVKVSTDVPDVNVLSVNVGGVNNLLRFEGTGRKISDTEPLVSLDDKDQALVRNRAEVRGNGKFKFQVREIRMIDTPQLGYFPTHNDDNIFFGVRVRFANTSNETIKLERGMPISKNITTGEHWSKIMETDVLSEYLAIFGEDGFPMEIPPKTVVEGFVPIALYDTSHTSWFVIQTNQGKFIVGYPESSFY